MTPFVSTDWWTVAKVLMGWSSFGGTMHYYPSLPSRFVVIPRHSRAKHQRIMQLDTEPFHVSGCTVWHIALSQAQPYTSMLKCEHHPLAEHTVLHDVCLHTRSVCAESSACAIQWGLVNMSTEMNHSEIPRQHHANVATVKMKLLLM